MSTTLGSAINFIFCGPIARLAFRHTATLCRQRLDYVVNDWSYRRGRPRSFADVHFRPDKLAFHDSVATTAGSQPFDPAAASPVPVIRKQLCFESVVAK